jgi:hypothetical protein
MNRYRAYVSEGEALASALSDTVEMGREYEAGSDAEAVEKVRGDGFSVLLEVGVQQSLRLVWTDNDDDPDEEPPTDRQFTCEHGVPADTGCTFCDHQPGPA